MDEPIEYLARLSREATPGEWSSGYWEDTVDHTRRDADVALVDALCSEPVRAAIVEVLQTARGAVLCGAMDPETDRALGYVGDALRALDRALRAHMETE